MRWERRQMWSSMREMIMSIVRLKLQPQSALHKKIKIYVHCAGKLYVVKLNMRVKRRKEK